MPSLFLIPSPIGDPFQLPSEIQELRHFIVENLREARRFLRWNFPNFPIDDSSFLEINKNQIDSKSVNTFLMKCKEEGNDLGLMSDAGLPCIADPGSIAVEMAHQMNFVIKPLVGPSSLLLALMASGFNGQSFAFHGYLPIKESDQLRTIKSLEEESRRRNMTQLFIETPYRNDKLLDQLIKNLHLDTSICIGVDLNSPKQEVHSKKVKDWKGHKLSFHKRPAVFLLYSGH